MNFAGYELAKRAIIEAERKKNSLESSLETEAADLLEGDQHPTNPLEESQPSPQPSLLSLVEWTTYHPDYFINLFC